MIFLKLFSESLIMNKIKKLLSDILDKQRVFIVSFPYHPLLYGFFGSSIRFFSEFLSLSMNGILSRRMRIS